LRLCPNFFTVVLFFFLGLILSIVFLLQQKSIVSDFDLLTRERLCCGLSLFQYVLSQIAQVLKLDDELWSGSHTDNEENSDRGCGGESILEADDNREFHRLWSALQFVVCLPPSSLTVE